MSLEEEFGQVLRLSIEDIYGYRDYTLHFDKLSALVKQGAKGNLNVLVDNTHCMGCAPYLTELVNFLLSEGVLPDIGVIKRCLYRGNARLLEDLLKYYDGPPVIEIRSTMHTHMLCRLAEVCYGFGISLMRRISIRENQFTLSALEHCIIVFSVHSHEEEQYQKFIEQTAKMYQPPNMELLEYLATISDIELSRIQKAYEIYKECIKS